MINGYVGLQELSTRTSLSPRTIRSWIHDTVDPLPAYRLGGKLLFRWAEVEAWIDWYRVRPTNAAAIADQMAESIREEQAETEHGEGETQEQNS